MNLTVRNRTNLAKRNGAYRFGSRMPGGRPIGLLWHSTGADNPYVRRYAGAVSGTDPLIGNNPNGNGMLQETDRNARNSQGSAVPCYSAVVGLATDLKMLTVKLLPDDFCPWASASGNAATARSNGFSGNNANFLSFMQYALCEDQRQVTVYGVRNPHTPAQYAKMCYDEMVQISVDFFRTYFNGDPNAVTPRTLTSHVEGNRMGIASGHSDPWHWLGKHGYTADGFRADVRRGLQVGGSAPAPNTPTPTPQPTPPTPAPSGTIGEGSVVSINPGAKYGGLSTSRGKDVPSSQFAPKRHTVNKIQTNNSVREARLAEINSWVAVSSLSLVGGTANTTPAPAPTPAPTVIRSDEVERIARSIVRDANFGGWGTNPTRRQRLIEHGNRVLGNGQGTAFADSVQTRVNQLMR